MRFFFKISDDEGLSCKGFVCCGFECFCLRFFHWFYRFPGCLIVCIPRADGLMREANNQTIKQSSF